MPVPLSKKPPQTSYHPLRTGGLFLGNQGVFFMFRPLVVYQNKSWWCHRLLACTWSSSPSHACHWDGVLGLLTAEPVRFPLSLFPTSWPAVVPGVAVESSVFCWTTFTFSFLPKMASKFDEKASCEMLNGLGELPLPIIFMPSNKRECHQTRMLDCSWSLSASLPALACWTNP